MLQKLVPHRKSDADFIDSTRQLVEFWDRYRVFVTIGGLAIICWSFWYLTATWQVVTNCDDDDLFSPVKTNQIWMLVSLFLGMSIGLNFAGLLSYLGKSIFGGYRAERLLLSLHAKLESANEEVIAE